VAGEDGAALTINAGKAELCGGAVALAGAVALSDGGTIEVSGGGTVTVTQGSCTVNGAGTITGLTDGTKVVLEQDGNKYELEASGQEVTVTKDGETKTVDMGEGGSLDGSSLEGLYNVEADPSQPLKIRTSPGKTKVLSSYDISKDTIQLAKETGTLSADKIILSEDGLLTYGTNLADGRTTNGVIDLSEAEKDRRFYTASLADKNGYNKQLVAWSGSKGGTLDLRSETKGAVMKDGGNREQDLFYGGKGNDTITLGLEDVAAGGAGRDLLIIGDGAESAAVALQDGDGHDSVQGFGFGFEDTASVVELNGSESVSDLAVDQSGRLKVGTATLEFIGTDLYNSAQTDLLVEDSSGRHKVAIGARMLVGGEAAGVYCGTGKNAEVDFTALKEDVLIDLNNRGTLGTATAALYGVKKVTGAKGGNNILAGQDGKSNLLVGGAEGANSLYGGQGGRDTLVGSASSEDTFYFGKGEGRDTITNSNDEDKVMLYNISLSDIDGTKTGVNKEGNMVIALSDGSSLTLKNYKNHGAETFQLADSSWRYDKQAGEWQQVKQG